jgi:hypothetical protein
MEDGRGYAAAVTFVARALVAAALALGVAANAPAQMGKGGKRGGSRGAQQQRESVDVYQVVLEELRVDLKLTSAQQPLWDAYVGKIEALRSDIVRQRRARPSEADAPRELDRLADVQRDRLTAMEDIAEAGKALYKTLDADQKAIADARLAKLVAAATAEREPAVKPPPK